MSTVTLICPTCRVALKSWDDSYHCPQCDRIYPFTMGIPSLLAGEIDAVHGDARLIRRLVDLYPSATFEELVRERLSAGQTTADCRRQYTTYNLSLRDRGSRFHQMFQSRLAQQAWQPPCTRLALDVGCGVGAGLLPLAKEFEYVIGIDLSLSSLIVAKKLVEEQGLDNVTLVHASAHQLPFLDGVFDYAMAINVLEHIFTPKTLLLEVRRVLIDAGVFCGDSRNRFDLLFPEPHVKLHWVGFLPRRWMAGYVRRRIGVDYNLFYAYLLSYRDLKIALKSSFGNEWRVVLPDVGAYGLSEAVRGWVEALNRIRFLHPLLIRLSPTHLVLARRTVDG